MPVVEVPVDVPPEEVPALAPPELEPPELGELPEEPELPVEPTVELPTVDAPVPALELGVDDVLEVVLVDAAETSAEAPDGTVNCDATDAFVGAEPPPPQAPTPTEIRTPTAKAARMRERPSIAALSGRVGSSACRSSGSR